MAVDIFTSYPCGPGDLGSLPCPGITRGGGLTSWIPASWGSHLEMGFHKAGVPKIGVPQQLDGLERERELFDISKATISKPSKANHQNP
jgi:hypothetical protein